MQSGAPFYRASLTNTKALYLTLKATGSQCRAMVDGHLNLYLMAVGIY